MISLKVEVSLFVPSPEIEDRNEVDAQRLKTETKSMPAIGRTKCKNCVMYLQ
jgi:hypothetical protein